MIRDTFPIFRHGLLPAIQGFDVDTWKHGESNGSHPRCGARRGHETCDVSVEVSIQLEAARALDQHVIGIAMDCRKCFDLLPESICFSLLSHQGAQNYVIDTERRFYRQLRSMYQVAGTLSPYNTRRDGFVQGCSFSLQAVQGLLAVRTRYIESTNAIPPIITTSGFLDDNNMRCQATHASDAAHALETAWSRSQEFDEFSGIQTNFQKTVVFANTHVAERLARKMFCCGDTPLALKRSFLLVGGVITTMGKPATSYRNFGITKAIKKIKRSRYAPVSFQQKAHLIAAACLPMAVYGSELQLPTQDQFAQLRRAVSAAMFKGFTWCRSPVLAVSLILPGQRVDAKALRALFEVAWTFVVPRQCKTTGLVA